MPVGHKAQSALQSGSSTISVEQPNEAQTHTVHPASQPVLRTKQVVSEEGTL